MWKRSTRFACVVGVVGVALTCSLQDAQARPTYSKVFKAVYPDYHARGNCNVCHAVENKSVLNDYGTAFSEALGEKNVKDAEAIEEALKKVKDKLPKKR